MTHVQARNYHKGRVKKVRLIVWHDMEAPEASDTAENVAAWFAGPSAPQASAHICADDDSVVETVKPSDTAWHAPGANADGYGVEQAGRRNQGHAGWRDPFSLATIRQCCAWLAKVPELAHIPDRFLSDAEVADGVTAGHVTHEQVDRVFHKSNHTDPGPDFPRDYVAAQMRAARGHADAKPVPAPSPYPDLGLKSPPMGPLQAIKNAQHAVNVDAGRKVVDEDGVYGPGTAKAVQAFKDRHGLTNVQGVDARVWAELRKAAHA